MTLYAPVRAWTNRLLPAAKFAFSYARLVYALDTRIPEMLFSRLALISPISTRVAAKASLILRRFLAAKNTINGTIATTISARGT